MKKMLAAVLAALTLCGTAGAVEVSAPSAILLEKETGTVLYTKDEHAKLEPASVTKVMTLLLTMEAIDAGQLSYDTMVTASAHACSMGGSQIWLKENEQMSVHDMLKAVCVVSANDCAVALGEAVAGSEEAFVEKMNQRAAELGMGIELNMPAAKADLRVMTWEEDAEELRVYMIAKEMGCKFYFGSDAHTVPGLGWAKRNAERIIDLLSLEEDDKFIL